MFPELMLKVTSKCLDNDSVECTGEQLSMLVNIISVTFEDLTWYASDVDMMPYMDFWKMYHDDDLKIVGETKKLEDMSRIVPQFLSGVFIAIQNSDIGGPSIKNFSTEEEMFVDIGNASIQIRAFDTSYFEVYLSKKEGSEGLLENLSCAELVEKNKQS